jgi:methionyl aminopeptidase
MSDIHLKTTMDVLRIKQSCRILEDTFHYLHSFIKPGITTSEINEIAHKFILKKGAEPGLKGYKGFPKTICTSVNNVAAHGIPGNLKLENGDIISIDCSIIVDGWYGDAAWSYIVGTGEPDSIRLIRTAWQASVAGILAVKAGNHVGDIGYEINKKAEEKGCSVIKDYVGHGIGENIHEDPVIPNYGEKGQGQRIIPGMVFTVEPIVNLGSSKIKVLEDGWTIVTIDSSLSAQFEHTVAVFKEKVEILTFSKYNLKDHLDQPPFF